MTLRIKSMFANLMVMAMVGLLAHTSHAQVGQHYLSYRFQTQNFTPVNVFLQDQFLQGQFTVVKPRILLNPVIKKVVDSQGLVHVYPITRPDLHYIGYQIQNLNAVAFPGAQVNISNQFETADIKVGQPRVLLAPAAKKRLPVVNLGAANIPGATGVAASKFPIPDAEHYLCYDVEPKTFQIPLDLQDEFQGRHFAVVERKHLCNPVIKEHFGGVFPADIKNKDNHLMCYRVIDQINQARSVIVRDQFGFRPGKTFEENEICVPTTKIEIQHSCIVPDDGKGSPDLTSLAYRSAFPLKMTDGFPEGSGIDVGLTMHRLPPPPPVIPGLNSFFDIFTELSLDGFGGLDYNRLICLTDGLLVIRYSAPSTPTQTFDTEMLQLDLRAISPPNQGQIGDPDFDLLRITGPRDPSNLPSPGHTTLTRMTDGNWAVDSFFDIEYIIEFTGKSGTRPLGGLHGSTTGTIRMHANCPLVPAPQCPSR